MLERDYLFFNEHRDGFVKEHPGEFVVIQNEAIVGFFPTQMAAFIAMKGVELGSFLVKQCVPADQDVIEYHTRRVVFA
jgi:hypothetical protein